MVDGHSYAMEHIGMKRMDHKEESMKKLALGILYVLLLACGAVYVTTLSAQALH